jgi:hypothetical protein
MNVETYRCERCGLLQHYDATVRENIKQPPNCPTDHRPMMVLEDTAKAPSEPKPATVKALA